MGRCRKYKRIFPLSPAVAGERVGVRGSLRTTLTPKSLAAGAREQQGDEA